MRIQNVICICLPLLLVGCATPLLQVDVGNLERSAAIPVVDLRPTEEKEQKLFSYLITSEAYGIMRVAQNRTEPNPLRILQHRVYENFGSEPSLPELKVYHFVIYSNSKSEMRSLAVGSALGGAIGAALVSGVERNGVNGLAEIVTEQEFIGFDKEYERAICSEAENPNKVSVYIVYLDAEINGKRVFVKTMTPARLPEEMDGNPYVEAFQAAISYYLDHY